MSMYILDADKEDNMIVEERHLVIDSDISTCVYLSLPRLGLLHITADLYGVFNNTFETLIVSSHCKTDTIKVTINDNLIRNHQCQIYTSCKRKELASLNDDKCVFICQCSTSCDNIFIQVQHNGELDSKICEITPMLL